MVVAEWYGEGLREKLAGERRAGNVAERGKVGVMAVESNTNVLLFSVKLWNNKLEMLFI